MTKKEIKVENCSLPTRLDRYFKTIYSAMTQGLIEKALRKGSIKLNGSKAVSNARVVDGDVICISNFIDRLDQKLETGGVEKTFTHSDHILSQKIFDELKIFENEFFIAINKPSDISSQSGSKILNSLDSAIQYINFNNNLNPNNSLKLVHRLDKDTSGIFLIAKGRANASLLAEAFKCRIIEKKYLAVLCGVPRKVSGEIDEKIKKDIKNQKQVLAHDGDDAITKYKILTSNDNFCVALFTPLTGRMHQIRVHALSMGCPILGDSKYGKKGKNLFLHAYNLAIPASVFGKPYHINCTPPYYFEERLNSEFGIEDLKIFLEKFK